MAYDLLVPLLFFAFLLVCESVRGAIGGEVSLNFTCFNLVFVKESRFGRVKPRAPGPQYSL